MGSQNQTVSFLPKAVLPLSMSFVSSEKAHDHAKILPGAPAV
jgi:hypothetical protein